MQLSNKKFNSSIQNTLFTLSAIYAVSHLVPTIISPLLTRYYTPSDFGVFSNYQSAVTLISIVVGGKYENSIILQKTLKSAYQVTFLSTAISIIISVGLQIIFEILPLLGWKYISINQGDTWIKILPVTALLCHQVTVQTEWLIREGALRRLSIVKLVGNASGSLLSLLLGVAGVASGLIYSYILGQLIVILASWNHFKVLNKVSSGKKRFLKMVAASRRNSSHPRFSIPAQLLNSLSGWLVVIFVNYKYGTAHVGYYALVDRVLSVPLSLLGMSVRDVLKSQIVKSKSDPEKCRNIVRNLLYLLIPILIVFSIVVMIIGEESFPIVFGEQWASGAKLVPILVVPSALSCISTSSFCLLNIFGQRKVEFFWQVVHLMINCGAILYGSLQDSAETYFLALAVARSFSFVILLLLNLRSVGFFKQKTVF